MLKMNEQEIYQKIGELLWSIMPNEAIEIYSQTTLLFIQDSKKT